MNTTHPPTSMTQNVPEISSVSDLIDKLKPQRTISKELWYRGQPNSTWRLTPSAFRSVHLRNKERELIARFRQDAAPAAANIRLDKWGWVVYAQHFGLPTRLLDWSQSPLIGLYFACEAPKPGTPPDEDHSRIDGSLYVLDPKELNDWSGQGGGGDPKLLEEANSDLDPYHPDAQNRDNKPKAVIAPRNFDRVRFQTGTFTVSPLNEQYLAIDDHPGVRGISSYLIPSSAKRSILDELETLGVYEATVYRDLDRVTERIKKEMS